ncbi:hypothetical protein COA26_28495, partial [Bacillus cereus]
WIFLQYESVSEYLNDSHIILLQIVNRKEKELSLFEFFIYIAEEYLLFWYSFMNTRKVLI